MTESMGLMKGNEAMAEAALRAGCRAYFGYPITPQNEIPDYMARRLPKRGGIFLQAESEVAAINMVYGAGGAGVRVMTSSSSPASVSCKGLSYIACAEMHLVIINMVRSGWVLRHFARRLLCYRAVVTGITTVGFGAQHSAGGSRYHL